MMGTTVVFLSGAESREAGYPSATPSSQGPAFLRPAGSVQPVTSSSWQATWLPEEGFGQRSKEVGKYSSYLTSALQLRQVRQQRPAEASAGGLCRGTRRERVPGTHRPGVVTKASTGQLVGRTTTESQQHLRTPATPCVVPRARSSSSSSAWELVRNASPHPVPGLCTASESAFDQTPQVTHAH